MPRLLRLGLMLFISLFASGMVAAQPVTVERDSNLLAEPRADAAVVGKVAKGTKAEALGKDAAWLNLKTPTASGWVLSFNVRFGEAAGSGEGAGAGTSVARVFGGKPQITATIGTRGVSEEELKAARFNSEQLALLESYAATKEQGEQRAREAGLVALKLDYLLK